MKPTLIEIPHFALTLATPLLYTPGTPPVPTNHQVPAECDILNEYFSKNILFD
jgi:hypothetical protein